MRQLLTIALVAITAASCVSKDKYDSAQYEAEYWKEAYDNLNENFGEVNRKYSQLVNEYNNLIDEYNSLNSRNYTNSSNAQEYKEIIERAKNAVWDLKNHFNNFRNGYWYDADDIERDIRNVESKLDGWL